MVQRDKGQRKRAGKGTAGPSQAESITGVLLRYETLLLFVFLFFAYNTVSIVTVSGDTVPAQLLPAAILYDHSIFFDGPFITSVFQGLIQTPDIAYAFPEVNGRIVSFFPIVTPVLVTPLYACSFLLSSLLHAPVTPELIAAIAKTSAACIAALSGVLLYLSAKELFSQRTALATTLVYAFATSTWSVSSQALWQHGMVELLLISLIYGSILNDRQPSYLTVAIMGIISGLFVFNRPPDAVLLIPVFVYIAKECRNQIGYYAAGCLAGGAPFFLYNMLIFGNIFGGYIKNAAIFSFGPDAVVGFVSLLVAPNLGLLVFSPVLLFSVYGYLRLSTLTRPKIRNLLAWFGPVILLQILVYSFFSLWMSSTAFSYGQRFLTGFIPVLALYIGVVISEFLEGDRTDITARCGKACFIILVAVSLIIQAIGVFYYPFNPVKTMDRPMIWDTDHMIIVESYTIGVRTISQVVMWNVPPLPPVFILPMHH
ncbi:MULTISPECIES: glycosyltransferase family 39 protein [unclassified Methanoregula]|uniref:glycosyltransferase family 39 protein n=1 Tax=unclassified Methanoregula TaxID=2649730 RepID=UPI0009C9ABC8|nr:MULTISPECIES: glycosyltransferase family 39 protein [unclassified Methanoregula]OPX64145.1 MAG: hypothetical protein A4E33_01169 [Methanoregula sp. PtaB.Bin085]OPY34735.1 MAG: hypothetical protein A4E34_01264 [Methanoregula sp. PtaU1.Bin006]